MKGRLDMKEVEAKELSGKLYHELTSYREAGISVTVSGYQADINRRLTDMLLREGPCTYMRSYSFDEQGRVTGVSFERVKLSGENNTI